MSSTFRTDRSAATTLFGFVNGGAIPTVCLGLGTELMRASLGAGASIPLHLADVGCVVPLIGWAALIRTGDPILSVRPVLLAAAIGTTWTLAVACMAYGMGVPKLPVLIIAPLTNNALIAVPVGGVGFFRMAQPQSLTPARFVGWADSPFAERLALYEK